MEFVMGNVQKIHKVDVIDYSKAAKIICSPTGNYWKQRVDERKPFVHTLHHQTIRNSSVTQEAYHIILSMMEEFGSLKASAKKKLMTHPWDEGYVYLD